jgi:hypothetical protein
VGELDDSLGAEEVHGFFDAICRRSAQVADLIDIDRAFAPV